MGHRHQVDGDLHIQIGAGELTLIGVVPNFPQGFGADREAQAGEGIPERPLVRGVLQAGVPKGRTQLHTGLRRGVLQQPAGIKKPAQFLLHVKHAVAIHRQSQLHRHPFSPSSLEVAPKVASL